MIRAMIRFSCSNAVLCLFKSIEKTTDINGSDFRYFFSFFKITTKLGKNEQNLMTTIASFGDWLTA